MKQCKYLYADWCHNPKYVYLELCNCYNEQESCKDYKEKVN